MPFSDFTLSKLRREFNIQHQLIKLFPANLKAVPPSERLTLDIEEGLTYPHTTEKAKSELLVVPILRELRRNKPNFSLFSGYAFDIDKESSLNGICDFILSARTDIIELEAPVFCIVEAKRDVLEDGLGQCAAAMLAARMFNQRDGNPIEVIYGAVTNAYEWVFLKLDKDLVLIGQERFFLNEMDELLGVLEHILGQYEGIAIEMAQ